MKKIFLNIEVHQPMRLLTYRFFEIMSNHYYYNDYENEFYIKKVSEKTYLPANRILHDLIHYYKSDFKMSFLFSGVVLDQFELYAPEIIDSYKTLLDTDCVELLSGTYSNSFGPLTCKNEFNNQVKLQKARIKSIFGKNPLPFPGRDLHLLRQTCPGIKIIISGNGKLNDKISYKVSGKNNSEWLLKPERLLKLLNTCGKEDNDKVNVFIPYNIFGDSQDTNSEILKFLESFPSEVFSKSDYTFGITSETEENFKSSLQIECTTEIGNKSIELFYSSCNELQNDAFDKLYSLSEKISKCNDTVLKKDWLYLQTCDHFHYMNPRLYKVGRYQGISLPYESPYFAFINYMNILNDFSYRLNKWLDDDQKSRNSFDRKNRFYAIRYQRS